MKKINIRTGILIFLVIIIWGYVGYRIYDTYSSDGVDNYVNNKAVISTIITRQDSTTPLKLSFSDPFLRKQKKRIRSINYSANTTSKNKEQKKSKTESPKTDKHVQKVNWPELKFTGILINNTSNQRQAIYTYNEQERMIGLGEELTKGLYVDSIWMDSVRIITNVNNELKKKTYLISR